MKKVLSILFFITLLTSCDLKTFGPGEVSDKIMITDSEGNILGGDLNNWQELDSIWLFSMLKPIYPNPTIGGQCTLYVDVQRTFLARLEFDNGTINEFYFPIGGGPIKYVIDGNGYNFRNQLRHLNIYINGTLYTNGYIQFD